VVSVPVSIEQPQKTHETNAGGFVNVLEAARECGVRSVVYASSSAVYGNPVEIPIKESQPLAPLSPYGASKAVDEVYAGAWERCYGLQTVGLRYFNVFGPRQDPNGAYAAVIPKWIEGLLQERPIRIFGDGSTTRDFCHVSEVVQANILAALWKASEGAPRVFNVGLGRQTRLDELLKLLDELTASHRASADPVTPIHEPFRAGDPRASCADITSLSEHLGFVPTMSFEDGLRETVEWFVEKSRRAEAGPARHNTEEMQH
jgi:UDP-N-acetylglucosamine 4-epimerase